MADEIGAADIAFIKEGGYVKYPNTTQKGGLADTGTYHRANSPDYFVWSVGSQLYGRLAGAAAAPASPQAGLTKGQSGVGVISGATGPSPQAGLTKGQSGVGIIQVLPTPPPATGTDVLLPAAPPKGKGGAGQPSGGPVAGVASVGYDADQTANIKTVLDVGKTLGAPALAVIAMLCLGAGENDFHSGGCNSSDHCGFFQLSSSLQSEHDYHDVKYWAQRAYQDGFWSHGGLIPNARAHPNWSPGYITNLCQGAYDNLDQGGAYYDQYEQEANNIFNTFGSGGKAISLEGPGSATTGRGSDGGTAPSTGGVFNLFDSLNWAGDFENLWKYAMGGADEAAKMADNYKAKVDKVTTVDLA